MKKIFITLSLQVFYLLTIAQSYIPFPVHTAKWTVSYCNYFSPAITSTKTAMYGDTVINSKNYKKLYSSEDSIFDIQHATYYAGLREENKRVFYILDATEDELLLYDFTKNIGDTVYVQPAFPSTDSIGLPIAGIDSVLLHGTYRKRYYFAANGSYHQDEYWIEGIGSTFGLFVPFLSITDNAFILRCFSEDNHLRYQNNTASFLCSRSLPLVICNDTLPPEPNGIDQYPVQNRCVIYPNPASGAFINIVNRDNRNKIENISLINCLGVEVLRSNQAKEKETRLNLEHFSAGLYYVRIDFRDKSMEMKKILVQ